MVLLLTGLRSNQVKKSRSKLYSPYVLGNFLLPPFDQLIVFCFYIQNSIEGPIEVGLVISFLSCTTFKDSICPPPNQQLGSILYNGPYNPQYPNPNPYHLQPHQNFTVIIPSGASQGKGQLAVTSFELRGVSCDRPECTERVMLTIALQGWTVSYLQYSEYHTQRYLRWRSRVTHGQ